MDCDGAYTYFAYGSNMSSRRLRQRTPSAKALGIGRLPGHALRWHKLGRDGSGKCDIAESDGQAGDVVWGVLYRIALAEKPILDRIEGLGIGYEEEKVRVETEAGAVAALTYKAKPGKIDAQLRPLADYKRHVLLGAKEHGLPVAYRRAIERVAVTVAAESVAGELRRGCAAVAAQPP